MKQILTLTAIIIALQIQGQINRNGIPFITNYNTATYNAAEQNWAIVQDNRGIMYFGNNDNGILEYDGVTWRKISNKNSSIIRSLATDSNGVVYAGSVNDFGRLEINNQGKFEYRSFSNLLDSSKMDYADVWKTFNGNGVNFCTEKYIFRYINGQLKQFEVPLSSFFSFRVNKNIYIGNYNQGLLEFKDGKTSLVPGGDFFKSKGIYSILPLGDNLLVCTDPEGLFELNPRTGELNKNLLNTAANQFLYDYQLYPACIYSNSLITFGTIQNGVIIADKNGNMINHYNKTAGLQDETVIDIYTANDDNIWLALNNGISKIEQFSAIKTFNSNQGIRGNVFDICRFNNRLFIATSLGVFYLDTTKTETPSFVPIQGLNVQTWSLLPFAFNEQEQLLVGTVNGLYSINKNNSVSYIDEQIRNVDELKRGKTLYIQKLYKPNNTKNEVYLALYDGAIGINYNGVRWNRCCDFEVNKFDIRHITQDSLKNNWFSTYIKGIFKNSTDNPPKIENFTNLPTENENVIGIIDGGIVAGTKKGLYKYDQISNVFIPDNRFTDLDGAVYYFNQDNDGNVWISAYSNEKRWVVCYQKDSAGNYNKNEIPFKRLPNELIDVIFHDNNGITWLGSSSGLYSFDTRKIINYDIPFNALVRKVTTTSDSVIFWGTYFAIDDFGVKVPSLKQPNELIPIIDYNRNDLNFEFAAPYFIDEHNTTYAYRLKGYKDTWSNWKTETKAGYTNLREGHYVFQVKAKNIYGFETPIAEYSFFIKPPWYRTILAYIVYFILIVLAIILIIKIYTHRLKLEKIRLEGLVQERTAEIRKQKEAIEVQNTVLQKQKEEILKQKEEITSSIIYAQRIQRAIVPSAEKADALLKDYFLLWKPRDIVSGDFWWLGEKNGFAVVTAADCTGHGVPGAFMSMLGVSFLNEIVNQQNITDSHEILNRLREKVKSTLGQTGEVNSNKDGMDMALLVIDYNKMQAQYSGAYNPLYLYRNNELIEYKADRNPIGVFVKEVKSFTQNNIDLKKGDTLYMFSDGYPDQFGGNDDKKFSTKRFKQVLLDIQDKTMNEQKEILSRELENYMNGITQTDDIIVLGIRI